MPRHTYFATSKARVATQVAPIELLGKEGLSVSIYTLMQSGSEETFLCESIAENFGIQINNYDTRYSFRLKGCCFYIVHINIYLHHLFKSTVPGQGLATSTWSEESTIRVVQVYDKCKQQVTVRVAL